MFASGNLRRRLAHAFLAGLGVLVALTSCSQGSARIENMDASWAVFYHSIGELKAHSDVAVVGTFTKIIGQTQDDKGVPYTDFALTVDRVLYTRGGRSVVPGSILRIHQTGGLVDNVTHQIADDVLFKVNESVALFLVEYQPGFYRVIGGPTGRFEVSNGRVSPPNNEGIPFAGDVDMLATQVKNA